MLNRGFSLFEMLLTLAISSMLIISITTFYPQFYLSIMQIYQQNRLEKATHQALAGLIKDIRRSGFIANSPSVITKPAIEINSAGNCIILRYDASGCGDWRFDPWDSQLSDVFAYRYVKNSLESQTGVTHCKRTTTRWERLFDPNEIKVTYFHAKQYNYYTELNISVALKQHPEIRYQTIFYVKNHNR